VQSVRELHVDPSRPWRATADDVVATQPITAQCDNLGVNTALYTFERGNGEGEDDSGNWHH
jgi:hypothetical protein